MKNFVRGTFLCIFITACLVIAIDRVTVEPDQLGMGMFIALVYVPPISILGCLIGEFMQRGLDRLKLRSHIIQFVAFLVLGFASGFLVVETLLYELNDLTIPLIAALGSISFFVGRNNPIA